MTEVDELKEKLRLMENQLIAARSLLTEHYDGTVRIWNPKRGGWHMLRADGAYVDADPPDEIGDYAKGWKSCHAQIVKSLDGFKTEAGCSAVAAVEVMKSYIRKRVACPTQD